MSWHIYACPNSCLVQSCMTCRCKEPVERRDTHTHALTSQPCVSLVVRSSACLLCICLLDVMVLLISLSLSLSLPSCVGPAPYIVLTTHCTCPAFALTCIQKSEAILVSTHCHSTRHTLMAWHGMAWHVRRSCWLVLVLVLVLVFVRHVLCIMCLLV